MTQAMKVYQIADALGMDYDTVVAKIRAYGIPVNNKMSKIDGDVAERIKSSLLKDKEQDWIEVELPNGVRKRYRKPSAAASDTAAPAAAKDTGARAPSAPAATAPRVVEAATPAAATPQPSAPAPGAPAAEPAATSATARAAEAPAARTREAGPSEPAVTPPSRDAATPPATAAGSSAGTATPPAPAAQPVEASAPAPSSSASAATSVEPVAAPPAREPSAATPPATATSAAAAASPEPTAASRAPAPREDKAEARSAPAATAVISEATPSTTRESEAPAAAPPRTASEPAAPAAEARTATPPSQPAPATSSASGSAPPAAASNGGGAASMRPAGEDGGATGRGAPSVPPVAKTGVVSWDPVTKQVVHTATPTRTRSVQVDQSRLQAPPRVQTRDARGRPVMGPARPGPAGRRPIVRPGGPKGPAPTPTQMGAHKRVVKIEGQIALQELARRMSVKGTDVMMKLLQMGMAGVNINSTLDADTAKIIAQEFQYEVSDVAVGDDEGLKALLPEFADRDEDYVPRAPVVTVMGHVDHGKTTLLDSILGMRVAEGEAGGITQKVSAYRVETAKGPVVFFDTPGHEAFTKLRARGANTTDVAVLVVAADDGVMPTTVEAINHVKSAEVPIVVAMNKMDKPDAKPERVVQQLMTYDVVPEDYGGTTPVMPVSAKQKTGIDELLERLALETEILELKANPKKPGRGTVFDATLDKGRGVVARVLVQDGTLRTGDVVLSGTAVGKIRAMFDDRGKPIQKAGPATPVEIQGLSEVPSAGDPIYVVADLKKAQAFAEERRIKTAQPKPMNKGVSLEDIQTLIAQGEAITLGIIIKAEAQASIEALSTALTQLSTDKVKINIVHTGIGGITETDVNLAAASKLIIIGFNVRPQGKAAALAETEKVEIRTYNIIYEAVDEMKALMAGKLKPTLLEKPLGKAEVRQVFNITKVGAIAGCMVTEGQIKRSAHARLVRDSVQIWEGKLASLRRFKEDAKEVSNGFECGIGLENYNDIKPGDVIEAFEIEEVAAKL